MRTPPSAILLALPLVGCSLKSAAPSSSPTDSLLPCPAVTLSPEAVEDLYRAGATAIEENRMGEYMALQSLETGLPMLKQAGLHGHAEALAKYAGIINWYGFIDTDGGPFMGRTVWENAEEGMLHFLLSIHLKGSYPETEAEHFRVLVDPSIPYPAGFFEKDYGFGWMLQHWTAEQLEPIRLQAFHWRSCWGPRPMPSAAPES